MELHEKANLISQYESKFSEVRDLIHAKDLNISDLKSQIDTVSD
jgi:hypothetical protein